MNGKFLDDAGTAELWDSVKQHVKTAVSEVGPYNFSINEDGDLILHYTGTTPPNFFINSNGELICGDASEINLGKVTGSQGPPGKSAYSYAAAGGYAGTEEQFQADLAEAVSGAGMSSVIRVTFPAGFAGRTYTATDGRETVTGVVPEGLTADIRVKDLNSAYTIRAAEPYEHIADAETGQYYGEYTAVSRPHIFGVEWDWTSSGPTRGTRTDAAAGFSDPDPAVNNGSGSSPFDALMPWAGMVKETRTGGVMVKEPKYWFKWTKTGKKLKLQIADGPVDGFHVDPVNMDRGDGLGELDFSYIGRYHCASDNWKSETGKAQKCSITRSAARSGIHGLGANIWQMDFAQMWYVGMLFLVEFADWNGERIGRGCSASGSKENNGKTDSMKYHTGTTAANRDTYGYTQYRNIEGWWDNVFDWMDGCYYTSSGLNVILNPSQFSDNANGTLIGSMPSSGYPNDMAIPTQSGFEWALRPASTGGSTTTYVPDNWDFDGSSPCLRHGGGYSRNQGRGPFCVYYNSASSTNGDIGCRLWERPPKA